MVRTKGFKAEIKSDKHPAYQTDLWLHYNPTAKLLDVKMIPYGPEGLGWFYVLLIIEVPDDFKENPIPKTEEGS